MRKLIIVVVIIVIFCALWSMTVLVPQHYVNQAEESLKDKCPACILQIEKIQVNPATGIAVADGVLFATDPTNNTFVRAKIDEIKVWVNRRKWASTRQLEINHVVIINPHILIEEKHHEHEPPHNPAELRELEASYGGKFLESLPPMLINSIEIQQGSLEYVLKIFGREAKIFVADINGEVSPLATRSTLGPRFSHGTVTARLQKSGLVTLNLQADLFSVKNEDKIEIDLQHQNLSEMDSFFYIEDGVQLHGDVHQVHAALNLQQGHLTGEMWGRYSGLDFHETPTPDVGVLKAVVTNLLEGVKTAESKPAAGLPPPRAPVDYHRLPGQSVTNMILKGLRGAAFKVISK